MRTTVTRTLLVAAIAHMWTVAGCDMSAAVGADGPPTSQFTIEDVPIWRLRVAIEVGDADDAGTDDYIWVQLQPTTGSKFYLDYGRNDFTRGSKHVYDISNLPKVLGCSQPDPTLCAFKVSDIEELTIGLEGDDGMYLKRVDLLINNSEQPIFTYTYSPGHWLDTQTGYSPTVRFSSADLRGNNSLWMLKGNPKLIEVPKLISHQTIESMIEGYAGDFIAPTKLFWNDDIDDNVVSQRASDHTSNFTMYFKYDVFGANPSVDVFFDIEASCPDGKLTLKATNFDSDVDYPLWLDIFSLGITVAIEHYGQAVADNLVAALSVPTLHADVPICTKGTFSSAGDLEIF